MYYWIKNFLSNTYKKVDIEKFKDSLMHLRVMIEEIEKTNIIERLETEKIKAITKKERK